MNEQILLNIAVGILIYFTLGLAAMVMAFIFDSPLTGNLENSWIFDKMDQTFEKDSWMILSFMSIWLILWPIVMFVRKK